MGGVVWELCEGGGRGRELEKEGGGEGLEGRGVLVRGGNKSVVSPSGTSRTSTHSHTHTHTHTHNLSSGLYYKQLLTFSIRIQIISLYIRYIDVKERGRWEGGERVRGERERRGDKERWRGGGREGGREGEGVREEKDVPFSLAC